MGRAVDRVVTAIAFTSNLNFPNSDEPSSVQHALAVARTIPWEHA